ncbi:replicative DNA helicase, partial [Candidatus Bathyarchaeota archaeon]
MFIDQVPPQDINTEQSILASCLVDASALEVALDILKPEDFYKKAHQNIFKTYQYLTRNKKPVDLTT